jgi:hypothetical protein
MNTTIMERRPSYPRNGKIFQRLDRRGGKACGALFISVATRCFS